MMRRVSSFQRCVKDRETEAPRVVDKSVTHTMVVQKVPQKASFL